MGFFFEEEKLTAYCLEKEHYFSARAHRLAVGCAFCNEERCAAAIEKEQAKKQAYNELRVAQLQQRLAQLQEYRTTLCLG